MGAWDEGPFANDEALDWLPELEGGGASELRRTLAVAAAFPADEYLDVDEGSSALAAAEVVASAFEHERKSLPAQVARWLEEEGGSLTAEDAALAKKAVERVLGAQSELSSLWGESGPENGWHTRTQALLARLTTHAGSAQVAEGALSAVGEREAGAREKQALFAFLQARGLRPNAQQTTRIDASRDRAEIHRWLALVVTATSVDALFEE